MNDGILVTVIHSLKEGTEDEYFKLLSEGLKDTAAAKGFRSLQCMRNKENPNQFIFIEYWDTEEDYKSYLVWRQQTDTMATIGTMIDGEVEFGYWTETLVSV